MWPGISFCDPSKAAPERETEGQSSCRQQKTPAVAGVCGAPGRAESLADLRGIAEGDGEEQGGDRQSQDQDVSEAFHG